ncbi:MAG: DEAD/DEAH box helicase family protein [Paramuribaculum sp.]|nr:DEAD/DEAH box helicase family protein [Paramuribaculum sp.]
MAADRENELDLCILVNGLPLLTMELKNEGTNQNYTNGIYQYRNFRDPDNRMLKNCLVHFVMDNQYTFMTTRLEGEKTNFLPFNRDSRNPDIEGEYPTAYMWQSILQADSLLDIIEKFIKRVREVKNGKEVYTIYFPRFHQLRAVRMLRRRVREDGPGHNYLIQHSAGSGKTKSMAWLAHQLANMTNESGSPIFDSIIMVTDRIVLNRNMADDVNAFETVAGTVKDIRKGSKNLATALDEGHRIIISTVQKFGYALESLKKTKSRKYAVIIDEAHTAIGSEANKEIVTALTTDEDVRALPDFDPSEFEDEMDALMAYMQVMRRQMSHISYFAFTATPKDKTFKLFGENGEAHDLYSMKQAIEEKFILDVLQNYRSYLTMFELIEKDIPEDEKKLFEEKKSLRVIYSHLNQYSYIKLRKAQMMLDHFMKYTITKIAGKAKAMVVCDSRKAAADYKQILDRLIAANYDGKIKTLVAFSGEVEDSNGRKCTEANMNDDYVTDNDITEKFKEDDYKILIVAEKFQTGFDQKLLHTMYVDRSLGGIQAIQTLSRLNRCHPDKEDTAVMDFRNDPDKILKAFQQYYKDIKLIGEVDTQRIYTMKSDIDSHRVFSEDEVREVITLLKLQKDSSAVAGKLIKIAKERVDERMEDEEKDLFRKRVNSFVRQYGFIAQFLDFTDPELEALYIFCKLLYPYLPYTKETLPTEIIGLIDLDKLRMQLAFDGQLELEDESAELKSSRIGEPGKKQLDEKKTVAEILDLANSPFAGLLNEQDKVIRQIWEEVMVDPDVTAAFSANNTYTELMNIVRAKFDEKVYAQIDQRLDLLNVLEREQSLSTVLISRLVDALYQSTRRNNNLPYDEQLLKERLIDSLSDEFRSVCGRYLRDFEEFVDTFFFVLNQNSIPSLDGVDDLIRTALNNVYCNADLQPVEKRIYFNSLVAKYEAYLKKLYYLINGEEIQNREGSTDTSMADAIFAFSSLRGLRNNPNVAFQKFAQYLELLRQWRNSEAHTSPTTSSDADVDAALRIVTSMYLYVTGNAITDLEANNTL